MTVWSWALVGSGSIAAIALAAWAHLRYWSRRLGVAMTYEIEERIPTADGSAVELRRVVVPEGIDRREDLPPVMLVHGLASSHRNHDAWPGASLARCLAASGRDVWLLTLRSGLADWHHRSRAKVRFAAMAAFDLDAGVTAIVERTARRQIDYVGFSMGGMLLYAAMGREAFRERVRRAATIGSPGKLVPRLPLLPVLRLLPASLLPRLPLRSLARLAAFASDWVHTPLHHATCNPRNFAKGAMARALVNCIEDVPGSLTRDFARWSFGDGTLRIGGDAVLDALGEVETPVLFLAGSADRLAPAPAVRAAFEAWGAAREGVEKELVLLGRAHGQMEDYGHGDLAAGARVETEVFARVGEFLDAR
ncbi:MAG: alpha/beta fold hydrolase [Deltaproteobacteria bacterium]|nr:alpha/beta fold hydrolase [Deltaproteobacteria bacterium]